MLLASAVFALLGLLVLALLYLLWLFGWVLDVVGAGGNAVAAWGWAWSLLGLIALVGPWATWRLHRQQHGTAQGSAP